MKIEVDACGAVLVVTNAARNRYVLQERRYPPGHPNGYYEGYFSCFGGGWLGVEARGDLTPRDTVKRESLREEFLLTPLTLAHIESVITHKADWMCELALSAVRNLGYEPGLKLFHRTVLFESRVVDPAAWDEIETSVRAGTFTNEGCAHIVSVDELLPLKWCYGHGAIIRSYLQQLHPKDARLASIEDERPGSYQVPTLGTYTEILADYNVRRTPF